MPWTADDAHGHTHAADSPEKRKKWAAIANSVLASGKSDAEAIREANGAISKDMTAGDVHVPTTMGKPKAMSFAEAMTDQDKEAEEDGAEKRFSVAITKMNPEEKKVFGWAFVSAVNGELVVDKQDDMILPEDLEKAAHDFALHFRSQGDMHRSSDGRPVQVGRMIESMVFTKEKMEKCGLVAIDPTTGDNVIGWFVGFKVDDPEVWDMHKRGERPEFSIGGRGRRTSVPFDKFDPNEARDERGRWTDGSHVIDVSRYPHDYGMKQQEVLVNPSMRDATSMVKELAHPAVRVLESGGKLYMFDAETLHDPMVDALKLPPGRHPVGDMWLYNKGKFASAYGLLNPQDYLGVKKGEVQRIIVFVKYSDDEARDYHGRWTSSGAVAANEWEAYGGSTEVNHHNNFVGIDGEVDAYHSEHGRQKVGRLDFAYDQEYGRVSIKHIEVDAYLRGKGAAQAMIVALRNEYPGKSIVWDAPLTKWSDKLRRKMLIPATHQNIVSNFDVNDTRIVRGSKFARMMAEQEEFARKFLNDPAWGEEARKFNPYHVQSGPEGGQFTSGGGSGGMSEVKPEDFISSRGQSTRPYFLSEKSADELKHDRLFMSADHKSGYALDSHGDLQNLFNNGARGGGRQALLHAIQSGATTLDAFDGHLPALYSKYGFVPTGRMKFADEYAPKGWNYDVYGRPDVVFMAYRGGNRSDIAGKIGSFKPYDPTAGQYFTDYDAAKAASRGAVLDKRFGQSLQSWLTGSAAIRGRGIFYKELENASRRSSAFAARLCGLTKYSPDQPRDWHGRWGDGTIIDDRGEAKAGDTVMTFRIGSREGGLEGKNSGNINAIADHLRRADDFEAPSFGRGLGDTITAYSLRLNETPGSYVASVSGKPIDGGESIGRLVDSWPNGDKMVAYYLPASGKGYSYSRVGSVPVSAIRAELKRMGFDNADDAGTYKTAEAIRASFATAGITKYSPEQPRDYHGRWTDGDAPLNTAEEVREAALANQDILRAVAKEIEKEVPGAKFVDPGAKSLGRLQRKLNEGKLGRDIKDAVRGGFEVRDPGMSDRIVEGLRNRFPSMIDEGWHTVSAGYIDRKVILRFGNGQYGELQMWPPGMLEPKNGKGHDLYEKWQSFPKGSAESNGYAQQMRDLYHPVREKLGPAWLRADPGWGGGLFKIFKRAQSLVTADARSEHQTPTC